MLDKGPPSADSDIQRLIGIDTNQDNSRLQLGKPLEGRT